MKRTIEGPYLKVVKRKNSGRTDVWTKIECPDCREQRWIKKSHTTEENFSGRCITCSKAIAQKSRVQKILQICKICGKEFFHIKSKNPKYCSWKCCWKDKIGTWPSVHLKGSEHPNWKGGISGETRLERTRFTYYTKPIILRRDNYICKLCGKRGGLLEIHHIHPWSKYPEERFQESNCITLCKPCHYEITWKGANL